MYCQIVAIKEDSCIDVHTNKDSAMCIEWAKRKTNIDRFEMCNSKWDYKVVGNVIEDQIVWATVPRGSV